MTPIIDDMDTDEIEDILREEEELSKLFPTEEDESNFNSDEYTGY
jgi:hypothetical protein